MVDEREIVEWIGDHPVYARRKPWPRVVGAAIPGLKGEGPERIERNERLSNGYCRLEVRMFGKMPDKKRFVSMIRNNFGDVDVIDVPIVGDEVLRPGFLLAWRIPWAGSVKEEADGQAQPGA